jgi:hypothetical protein
VDVHVEHREEGIWIAFFAISLYGSSDERLGQNELGEFMRLQYVGVCLKELGDKSLESDKVDVGVGIKELKVDLDEALLHKH